MIHITTDPRLEVVIVIAEVPIKVEIVAPTMIMKADTKKEKIISINTDPRLLRQANTE